MKLRSHIDFPAFVFQKYNSRKELMGVATVAALFDIGTDGVLRATDTQRPIQMSDEFRTVADGPPQLARTSDFVPFRPATDVTVLAQAHAPGGTPQATWVVGLMVGERRHVLRVHGPRHWQHKGKQGWQLSDAQAVTEVPLDWSRSFGGKHLLPEGHPSEGEVNIWNPAGPGILTRDTPHDLIVPAAQIELRDAPVLKPFQQHEPQGLAPIAPVWRFREQFAGTYDETWVKTQHPFLPPDFDPRFYNVAPPPLQFEPMVRGDELIRAAHLYPGRSDMAFYLPGLAFGAVATHESGLAVKAPLFLDGVHLELLDATPQVRLTWRVSLPWRDGIKMMDVGPLDFAATAAAGALV